MANAIFDGTDAVMLSQETAVGQYPVETVAMMASIAERTEQALPYREWNEVRVRRDARDPAYTVAYSACAGRARPAPGRDRDADALRALRPPGRLAPSERADLRALTGARDGPPLRPDVGCARRIDAPPRGDRGADRRRRPACRRARLGQARAARRDHRGPAERPSRARPACCRFSASETPVVPSGRAHDSRRIEHLSARSGSCSSAGRHDDSPFKSAMSTFDLSSQLAVSAPGIGGSPATPVQPGRAQHELAGGGRRCGARAT